MPYPNENQFRRWRIPFLGKGSIGSHGSGHWWVLGVLYAWNDNSHFGYAKSRRLNLWGLIRVEHEERNHLKAVRPGFTIRRADLQWPIRRILG